MALALKFRHTAVTICLQLVLTTASHCLYAGGIQNQMASMSIGNIDDRLASANSEKLDLISRKEQADQLQTLLARYKLRFFLEAMDRKVGQDSCESYESKNNEAEGWEKIESPNECLVRSIFNDFSNPQLLSDLEQLTDEDISKMDFYQLAMWDDQVKVFDVENTVLRSKLIRDLEQVSSLSLELQREKIRRSPEDFTQVRTNEIDDFVVLDFLDEDE